VAVKITYFVHGTTTDNESDIATGWNQGQLSDTGKHQAVDLGKQVANKHFDTVFCSDLKRALESAYLGFGDKYEIIPDDRLRECDYGELNGTSATSFKDNLKEYIGKPFPGGECYDDVELRMRHFIEFLKTDYDGKHIAIVAHQAPQLALDVILRGKSWEQAIDEDWRRHHAWQPGWKYEVK
jgi:broad specificity phosphatase PhoE